MLQNLEIKGYIQRLEDELSFEKDLVEKFVKKCKSSSDEPCRCDGDCRKTSTEPKEPSAAAQPNGSNAEGEGKHLAICVELGNIYHKKNHDYGNSFHKGFEEWGMPMALIRLQDKLERLKALQNNKQFVQNECVRDTLLDLANYSIMTIMEIDRK